MGFFAEFNTWLNALLNNYIGQYTAQMAAILEPTVVTLATLYVIVWGYLHMTGRIQEPVLEGMKRIAILAVVCGVGFDLWLYNSVIVDTFFNAPSQLTASLVGATNFVTVIDDILFRGDDVATALLSKAGILHGNISFYFAALAVYLIVGVTAIYTMFLLTLSRIALSVLLALGPLIIPLFLFDATRRFVEAWLAQLANYAFVAILAGLVAALMMTVIDKSAAQAAAVGGGIQIAQAVRVCMAAGFTFLVMRQVLPMASALASGVALNTFGVIGRSFGGAGQRGLSAAGNFLRGAVMDRESTRWDPLSRKAGYLVKSKVQAGWRGMQENSIRE
jgi:type IV secretion system protein VirB6